VQRRAVDFAELLVITESHGWSLMSAGMELYLFMLSLKGCQPVSRARATVSAVMSRMGTTTGQRVKRSTAVRQYV
jgi:hypothetical protein